MSKLLLFILLSLIFNLWSSVYGGIIRVPQDQPGIQAGINAATNGDTVLVADSTYYENINFMGKAITVASYYITDLDTNHINNTIINGSQPANPNAASVVSFVSGEDTTAVICGFTITGGTGTLYDALHKVGGGIYCSNSGARIVKNKIILNSVTHNQVSLGGGVGTFPRQTLSHLLIEDNLIESNSLHAPWATLGGGIFIDQGTIKYNKIKNNLSSGGTSFAGFGGGIFCASDTTIARTLVKIIGNEITNNEATTTSANHGGEGGGIAADFGLVQILDNQITYNRTRGAQPQAAGVRLWYVGPSLVQNNNISFNTSSNPVGVLWGLGGGLAVFGTNGLIVQENHFEGNEIAGGGGVASVSNQGTLISKNIFFNNYAYIGGGVHVAESSGDIINANKFMGNAVDYYGGGIMIEECSPKIYNNLIFNNKATLNGGGIYIGDQNCEPEIVSNTIMADTAGIYGGGIFANSVSPRIMNSIIWGNVAPNGEQIYTLGGNTQVVYSDVQGGWPGQGNVSKEPMLRGDSLILSDSSSCIGAGTIYYQFGSTTVYCPSPCFLGNTRPSPLGTNPDLGACESLRYSPLVGLKRPFSDHIPRTYNLKQNYPNPFNPITNIEFQIPNSEFITLKVFNLQGQEVVTLVRAFLLAGDHSLEWDASGLASGVYYYGLETPQFCQTRKMLLIK